jgi:hypothetical protein
VGGRGGERGRLTGADARLELPAVEQLLPVVGDGGPAARGGGVLPVGHLVLPQSRPLSLPLSLSLSLVLLPSQEENRAPLPRLRKTDGRAYPLGLK